MERNRMHAHLFSAYGRLFRLSWMMDDTGSLRFGLFRLGGAAGNTYKIVVTHATRPACTMTYIEPVRCLTDGGREEDWSDLWTNLDPWCWRKYCDDEGNLHLSVTIGKLHSN
ncbi:unnamed protein product [Callosobruchus maculatus]|uniref:Uncharacterized protein n=1 Tax=Callosobruchus maculatus TaxID=64391 RepID=A0A653CU80_CALMS|nr:unnamed protein product [Callosobruchus maculatus]